MSTNQRQRVYVARKECGCIVAAWPVLMDKNIQGEILKQFSKAGYTLEQASETDVRFDFRLICDHNKPPLLAYAEQKANEPTPETVGDADDEGVGTKDVDAAGEDWYPEAEEAEEQEADREAVEEARQEATPQ
jgi:hypothetical protein